MKNRTLGTNNRQALLLGLNQLIEESADNNAIKVVQKNLENLCVYPPNGGFTRGEMEALRKAAEIPSMESALRKVIADACGSVVFHTLNFIDGTGDPDFGDWTGVELVDVNEETDNDGSMLHDDFYDAYWDWRKIRPKKDWNLDTLED